MGEENPGETPAASPGGRCHATEGDAMPATRTRMTAVAGPATAVAPGVGSGWAPAGWTADPWH